MGRAPLSVAAVIPAFNEAPRLAPVIRALLSKVDRVIVVDDGSVDQTASVAEAEGAHVIHRRVNGGYKIALVEGMRAVHEDIILTLDADGEHRADLVDVLVGPIKDGRADAVFATRPRPPRWSERLISRLTSVAVETEDSSTGLRAIRTSTFAPMTLPGPCLCGTFLLEATTQGARVLQIGLPPVPIEKPRRRSWVHWIQVWYVLREVTRARGIAHKTRNDHRNTEFAGGPP